MSIIEASEEKEKRNFYFSDRARLHSPLANIIVVIMRRILLVIWETIEVAVISLAVVLVVRNFLIQPFFVDGDSMIPNFHNGDYLIVDELSYRFRSPERGEVIVFHPPQNPGNYYIKRVIGLPGETVQIKNGQISVLNNEHPEGFILSEDYIHNIKTSGDAVWKLAGGQYFVLGDNRYMSFDSRTWGVLPQNNIVGVVRLRIWPIMTAQAFTVPQYNY